MADEADRDGTGAESGAAPPNGSLSFAKKARDLEVLRSTVIDAAGVGAGLWLSYLFVLFYLAIAVGSVTHRNLLFESRSSCHSSTWIYRSSAPSCWGRASF
jgi:hypothetical protein